MQGWLALGPTHIAPSYATHPRTGDVYGPYNKPLAIIDWLTRSPPEEEWIVILDSDMIMHLPFVCGKDVSGNFSTQQPPILRMDCQRGRPIAAWHFYLHGVSNELAAKHLPEVQPLQDKAWGQPAGRRADQVGGVFVIHRDDLTQYMRDWLAYTERVREDTEVCAGSSALIAAPCRCCLSQLHAATGAASAAPVHNSFSANTLSSSR